MPARPGVSPSPLLEGLAPHLGAAYLLACRVLGDRALAEDAVQEALLRCTGRPPRSVEGRALAAYFLRVVHGISVNLARSETARRSREEKAAMQESAPAVRPDAAAALNEAALAARQELDLLAPELRTAVCLCCEQGFTQNEAAEILEVPLGTVARRVQRGLDELRERMTRLGHAALAPAALAGMLGGLGIPPVPASLGAAFAEIARGSGAAKIGGIGATAAKGGLLMKIGLGVAAIGLAAGTTFWAVGGKTEEPAKAPPAAAEKKSKFDIPIWHPDARWSATKEDYIGNGAYGGPLDGPRLDVVFTAQLSTGRLATNQLGGPYGFTSYDPDQERVHLAAGSGRGVLDGPFSRARFIGGWHYMNEPFGASSPDGRYLFVAERGADVIRRLDLEKQQVVSIPRAKGHLQGMFADNKGKLYILMYSEGKTAPVNVVDLEGKFEKKLELQIPTGGSYLLDEVNDRLYWACGNGTSKWYVGYFDMKAGDGVFHGLLPNNGVGIVGANPGPFKTFRVYSQLGLWFGADDPDRNFIYMGACDTNNTFRLDLKKEEVWVCSQEADGIRYIFSGKGKGNTGGFDQSGDIMSSVAFWSGPRIQRQRRIK